MQILPITDIATTAATMPTTLKGVMQGLQFANDYQKQNLINKILSASAASAKPLSDAEIQKANLDNIINQLKIKYFPDILRTSLASQTAKGQSDIAMSNVLRYGLGLPPISYDTPLLSGDNQQPQQSDYTDTSSTQGSGFGSTKGLNLPMSINQLSKLRQIFGGTPAAQQDIDNTQSQGKYSNMNNLVREALNIPSGSDVDSDSDSGVDYGQDTNVSQQQQPSLTQDTPSQSIIGGQSPNDMIKRMGVVADILGATKGQKTTQQEEEMAATKATSEVQAKSKQDLLDNYSLQAEKASDTNDSVNIFDKYYGGSTMRGPVFGKGSFLDSNAQIAVKAAATMLKDNLFQFKGLGQVRVAEITALARAQPDIKLSPEAVKEICNLMRINNAMIIKRNSMAQQFKDYTNDPSEIRSGIEYVRNSFSPIDKQGNIHSDALDLWDDYDNQDAFNKISKGKDYIPESLVSKIKPYHLNNLSKKQKNMILDILK